jgi:phage-related protein
MASNLQAVYYRASDGIEPVLEFIEDLDAKRQAALIRQLDRLNELSDAMPHLPFPHSSQVDGELREMRCHMGSEHYRVLYRRSERLIVLLHAFRKTTGKLPPPEIQTARNAGMTSKHGWMRGRANRREQPVMMPPDIYRS